MDTASLLNPLDAARLLATSNRKLSAMVRGGQIPYITLPSGEIRFSRIDLESWLKTLRHAGDTQEVPA